MRAAHQATGGRRAIERAAGAARALAFALSLLVLGPGLAAALQSGEPLPAIHADDVTGEPRALRELIHGPTLLVAIVDRGAGDAMRAWFDAAGARAPHAHQVSIISIGKPFFVSDAYARSKAREQVPRAYWHASLLDTDHGMAKQLGLGDGALPYAFAVSGDGRVLAAVHGKPDSPQAEGLWGALNQGSTPPAPAPRGDPAPRSR